MTDGKVQAGWYAAGDGSQRYWDGTGWTEHVRYTPLASPPPPATPAQKRGNPMGIVAFAVAALGFIASCIPVVLVLGWLLLPLGFILGIVSILLQGRRKWAGVTAIIVSAVGTLVAVFVFLGVVGSTLDTGTDDAVVSAPQEAEEEASTELPAGFEDTGVGVALRWSDIPECDYGRCAELEVLALQDCPGALYIEANILNASGTIVGYTNDVTGSLVPGDRAVVTLSFFEDDGTRVELTDVNCY